MSGCHAPDPLHRRITVTALTASERLPFRTKLLYGVGDTGFSLTSTIISAYFAIFLIDVVGLTPGMAAIAVLIGRAWDWINDPLIGHISDRTRTRWGRRRPFLLVGFIPYGLAFAMLWWIPPWSSSVALIAYYALAYLFYEAAATFVYMPYFALTPELTLDYDERTSLTSYRMFFSIFASLLAFTVPLMIIGAFRPENHGRVWLMGSIFAAASALPLLLTFFGTQERPEFQQQTQPRLRESIKAALRNRPFLFAAGIFLLTWTTIEILNALLLFFLKYWMGIEAQSEIVMATIFIVAIISLPAWSYASHRWNKRRTYVIGIAFFAAVQIVLVLLQPGVPLWLILTLASLAGVGVGAAHVIPWAMIPDAIEWGELETGQRHEGMFYSLITLTNKIASSIAIPLVLGMLEWTGYISNAAHQPHSALLGIRFMVGPLPAILLCGGIAFALLYPIDRERHQAVRQELQERRLAKQGSVIL
jgi:glycoside/pentoside/hexuronide:cation symporter, GPH family